MTQAKHTPGPWGVRKDGCVYYGGDEQKHIRIVSPWIEGAWEDDAEALANMRLIAMAPTLLAVLRSIANTFDESWVLGCVERAMGDNARAAIARAEGR